MTTTTATSTVEAATYSRSYYRFVTAEYFRNDYTSVYSWTSRSYVSFVSRFSFISCFNVLSCFSFLSCLTFINFTDYLSFNNFINYIGSTSFSN